MVRRRYNISCICYVIVTEGQISTHALHLDHSFLSGLWLQGWSTLCLAYTPNRPVHIHEGGTVVGNKSTSYNICKYM